MKTIRLMPLMLLMAIQQLHAQQKATDQTAIINLINQYSKSVIERDSIAFYRLFNAGTVTWCAALKDGSQEKEVLKKGKLAASTNYFSGSYKGFMRGLFRYKKTEDKFDNIKIYGDGTVATVMMDYSFWADGKMTNWGNKYLGLIKRDGDWKITSVIYSLELTDYFAQPALKQRQKIALLNTY